MPADVLVESHGIGRLRVVHGCRGWEEPAAGTAMADDRDNTRSIGSGSSSDTGSPTTVLPAQNDGSSSVDNGSAMAKRSANMTETVRVPTSEHVAEIVGRQGCKIKALRAKTNTYIKTPARGEEPVFVVTGRQEDVAQVKQEILSAAEHFSQIRTSRRNASSSADWFPAASGPIEQVREKVPVPFWVVGLVVGPKGSTIRRIQQETQTYIITPGKEKEPVFEIVGTAENVARARQEIKSHIMLRMRSRQNQPTVATTSWTKLDNLTNSANRQHYEIPRNGTSQTGSGGSFSDPKFWTKSEGRHSLTNECVWKQTPGASGRPISIDVGELFKCFPSDEKLPPRENDLLQSNPERPQASVFGIEVLLSNCLSDLNLNSNGNVTPFYNEEFNSGLTDLLLLRQPLYSAGGIPFVGPSSQADKTDLCTESTLSFHAPEQNSQM